MLLSFLFYSLQASQVPLYGPISPLLGVWVPCVSSVEFSRVSLCHKEPITKGAEGVNEVDNLQESKIVLCGHEILSFGSQDQDLVSLQAGVDWEFSVEQDSYCDLPSVGGWISGKPIFEWEWLDVHYSQGIAGEVTTEHCGVDTMPDRW